MHFLGKFPSLPVGSLLKFRVGLVCFFGVQLATSKDKVALEASGNGTTVDGWIPANQLRLVVYPIIYRVSATSQVVVWDFSHQQ